MATNGSNGAALTKVEHVGLEADDKAIEALVMKGDIAGLEPRARAEYYVALCRSLGLNPATQPIKFIAFQGKTIPYFTRDATDQLAASKRLNREIIAGPEPRDYFGQKLLYALCRGTLPNGRVETATSVVCADALKGEALANAIMRCETKARRRVTLAICGLGFISEDELDTMSGAKRLSHAEAMGAANDVPRVTHQGASLREYDEPLMAPRDPALDDLADYLGSAETFDAVVACYDELAAEHQGEAHVGLMRAAYEMCCAHLAESGIDAKPRTRFSAAIKARQDVRDAAKRAAHAAATTPAIPGEPAPVPGDAYLVDETPVELRRFYSALDAVKSLDGLAPCWLAHRAGVEAHGGTHLADAKRSLAAQAKHLGVAGDAKAVGAWLKRAITAAEKAATREPGDGDEPPPTGSDGAPARAGDAATAAGDAQASAGAAGSVAALTVPWAEKVAEVKSVPHAVHAWDKYGRGRPAGAARDVMLIALALRLQAIGRAASMADALAILGEPWERAEELAAPSRAA